MIVLSPSIFLLITFCRVEQDFKPDTGLIEVFRSPGGMGIRIDDGPGFQGANISPHYDSLLMKITASAPTRRVSAKKVRELVLDFNAVVLVVVAVKTSSSFAFTAARLFLTRRCCACRQMLVLGTYL